MFYIVPLQRVAVEVNISAALEGLIYPNSMTDSVTIGVTVASLPPGRRTAPLPLVQPVLVTEYLLTTSALGTLAHLYGILC